jgi:hypothetical protein
MPTALSCGWRQKHAVSALPHFFDPNLAVSASQIEALPHQITAVYGEMLPRQPLRFLLADDPGAGKAILRDYIKATVGFEKLGEPIGTLSKSLIRIFGPRGNPQTRNPFRCAGVSRNMSA